LHFIDFFTFMSDNYVEVLFFRIVYVKKILHPSKNMTIYSINFQKLSLFTPKY